MFLGWSPLSAVPGMAQFLGKEASRNTHPLRAWLLSYSSLESWQPMRDQGRDYHVADGQWEPGTRMWTFSPLLQSVFWWVLGGAEVTVWCWWMIPSHVSDSLCLEIAAQEWVRKNMEYGDCSMNCMQSPCGASAAFTSRFNHHMESIARIIPWEE